MERRTLWAILLMMAIAIVPAFFIKRNAAAAGYARGRQSGGRRDSTGGDSPRAPPDSQRPARAGRAGAQDPAAAAAPRPTRRTADTVTVTSDLYTYYGQHPGRAHHLGAAQPLQVAGAAAEHKQPVELVRPGGSLLDLALVAGGDTLRLDHWNLHAVGHGAHASPGPTSLTLTGGPGGLPGRADVHVPADDYQVARVGPGDRARPQRRPAGGRAGRRPPQHRSRLGAERPRLRRS